MGAEAVKARRDRRRDPHFLKALAEPPTDIEPATDVDNLLSYLAVNALIENTDGLAGDTGVEDHYQYFDPASGKFLVLPWDPDDTLGANNTKVEERSIYTRFSKSRLLTIIRDYGSYHTRYRQRIKDVMAALPVGQVQAEIDRIYDRSRTPPTKIPQGELRLGVRLRAAVPRRPLRLRRHAALTSDP